MKQTLLALVLYLLQGLPLYSQQKFLDIFTSVQYVDRFIQFPEIDRPTDICDFSQLNADCFYRGMLLLKLGSNGQFSIFACLILTSLETETEIESLLLVDPKNHRCFHLLYNPVGITDFQVKKLEEGYQLICGQDLQKRLSYIESIIDIDNHDLLKPKLEIRLAGPRVRIIGTTKDYFGYKTSGTFRQIFVWYNHRGIEYLKTIFLTKGSNKPDLAEII